MLKNSCLVEIRRDKNTTEETKSEYTLPEIVHEIELETKADSPETVVLLRNSQGQVIQEQAGNLTGES